MTIPAMPLPRALSLFADRAPFPTDQWATGPQDRVCVYRRGSMALAAGIEAVRNESAPSGITIWLPGYFCNDALGLTRRLPVTLRFYPIQDDLTPDWKMLEASIARERGHHALVVVHYFGFPNSTGAARAFCEPLRVKLVEDAAHVLRPGTDIGRSSIVVFSPRKLLAAPWGGVLVIDERWSEFVKTPSGIAPAGQTLHWLGLRLAQRAMLGLHIPWHKLRRAEADGLASSSDASPADAGRGCDRLAIRLLANATRDLAQVVELRRRNYTRLTEWVGRARGARPFMAALPQDVCPYVLPVFVEAGCAEATRQLVLRGVPASRWPDLPPEVLAAAQEHATAMRMYHHLMLLPVHQGLSLHQVDAVGRELVAVLAAS
jgi:hypothetical protein